MGSPNPNSEEGRTNNAEAAKQIHKEMAQSRVPVTMRDFFFDDPFFKNSWDDFDKVRDRMFSESRDMWKRFDDDFRNMACMSNNIMLESDHQKQQQSIIDETGFKIKMGEWMDVPQEVDVASIEHRFPQQHGHLQEQGQRGHQGQGRRHQDGGEPRHQPVQAR